LFAFLEEEYFYSMHAGDRSRYTLENKQNKRLQTFQAV